MRHSSPQAYLLIGLCVVLLIIIGGLTYYFHTSRSLFISTATNSSADYKGVYVLTPKLAPGDNESLAASTYALPYIDGIGIRISWDDIEPTKGTFDWSVLDPIIKNAVANHKKISIGIGSGEYVPAWVYSDGVPGVTFSETNGDLKTCTKITEPIPWNATYQQDYAGVMMSVADHFRSIPGAYEALTVVKVTGISENSDELHMTTNSKNKNEPDCQSNGSQLWQAAGYKPSLAISAWKNFAAATHAAFPDKQMAQVLYGDNAFPQINEEGKFVELTDPEYVNVRDTVVAYGAQTYGKQFGGLFDALAIVSFKDVGETAENGYNHGGVAYYQTNHYGGPKGGAECGLDEAHNGQGTAAICTNTTYQQLLQNGVNHHGTYFEIWEPNAISFPDAITAIRKEIL